MAATARRTVSFVRTVAGGISRKNVPFMAASIAYQAFISLIPLLVLVFFVVSLVGDEALAQEVTATTEGFLPESGQALLEDAIAGSVATAGASVIGLVTLVWGTLKIFRGLDTAFSEIYGTTAENTLLEQVRDGLVVFVALAAAILAAVVAASVFAMFPQIPYVGVLNPLLLVAGLTVAFLPMYYVFPDVDLSVRDVLPGVLVAAVGWAALEALFQVYVAFASSSDSAGAVGAILLLLTWLYFGGIVLLVGAVVNAAVTGRLSEEDSASAGVGDDRRESSAERTAPEDQSGEGSLPVPQRPERRIEELVRERDQLRNDLASQRERRYRLEDRTDRLERDVARLERENERLRRQIERVPEPWWKRLAREIADRTSSLSVGTVRKSRD